MMEELRTPRLHLRHPMLDDLDAHYAMVGSDPVVTWNAWCIIRKRLPIDEIGKRQVRTPK
jgi:hypothetical protein